VEAFPLSAPTNYPCGHGGSCPQLLDLEPNPSLHFSTGGYAPTPPLALPAARHGTSYAYSLAVQGGAVPWRFSTPSGSDPLGTEAGACLGLMLDPSSGTISGSPTTSGTCGPFTARATDAAGQFVEREFMILVE